MSWKVKALNVCLKLGSNLNHSSKTLICTTDINMLVIE